MFDIKELTTAETGGFSGEAALNSMQNLTLFNATIQDGVPQKLEHNDIKWINPAEIPNYNFCPADEEILEKLKRGTTNE